MKMKPFYSFISLFIELYMNSYSMGFSSVSVVKNLPANAGEARDTGSVPGLGVSPGGGNGNPLQYASLGNTIDKGV